MKNVLFVSGLLSFILLGSGCAAPQNVATTPITTSTISTADAYSVDEFVTDRFKQGRQRIRVQSVTCYNNACSLDGTQWDIGLTQEESGPFLAFAGNATSFIVEAESACSQAVDRCHKVKNVRIVTE